MTQQVPERFLVGTEVWKLVIYPMIPTGHPQIAADGSPPHLDWSTFTSCYSTACHRRYEGTWRIRKGWLQLVAISGRFQLLNGRPVTAEWHSGEIKAVTGRLLGSRYGDLFGGSWNWECERVIGIDQGRVTSAIERCVVNGERTERRLRLLSHAAD